MVDILLPEVADEKVALLLAVLDKATREWRKQLGEVSPDALSWQPIPGGHSIGVVLLHMADVEGFCLYEGVTGQARSSEEITRLLSVETEQYAGKWPVPPAEPLEWFYQQQESVRRRTLETAQTISDLSGERALREDTFTVRWLLSHVVAHESYHGGQAVLLHEIYKAGHR